MNRSPRAEQIPQPVVELSKRLLAHGHRSWVVGGSLRDLLLERVPGDWDLATDATPQQVMAVFSKVIPTGEAHGTVTVLHRGQPYEVTTLRGEGAYSDSRRPDEVFFVGDIEQDLARRDLTVNAVAFDVLNERLIDPFGGLDDLQAGILRTVGAAHARFAEDGLRVLRAARFAATLEFSLEPETERAIGTALDSFRQVSKERVRDEWLKTMKARRPSRAFEVMRRTGILEVCCPDLMDQVGCTQNRYHTYDVWGHSMHCMDASEKDPVHRVAALLHDLGKPRTRALSDKTNDYTFYNHEHVGAGMADQWLKRYRFSNDERQRVVHLVRHHLICYDDAWSDAAVRRFVKRVGQENIDDLLHLGRADALAKGRPVQQELEALERLHARVQEVLQAGAAMGTRDLAISGKDVMQRLGIRPSRRVGEVLEALLERVLDDPSLNEREALLGLVDGLGPEEGP